MVDEIQIKQWLKDKTITQAQAKKMLADASKGELEGKSNKFISVVAIIGAVLIFIGFAWLIAKNWHQIPNAIKILILISATLAAFVSGFLLRQNNHEGVGRSLIALGALFFILSVFLIAQIYATPSGLQGYAWLLLICWSVIMLTAYFLDSKENLVISMIAFFPWLILQYLSYISKLGLSFLGGPTFGFILILLSAGALLFGLSILHNSLGHKFTITYRFWTVFYFLLIFYILSMQSILPVLSEYSFASGAFFPFSVFFIVVCFLGFIIAALYALSRSSISLKEILGFIVVLAILFVLILSTKAGAGLMGMCYLKNCNDYNTPEKCSSAPGPLICEWTTNQYVPKGFCNQIGCPNYITKEDCNSASDMLDCIWHDNTGSCYTNGDIAYETCHKYDNQKNKCADRPACTWNHAYGFWGSSGKLPTILWVLWIISNIVFIGFIIFILWYGQYIGSTEIVNLAIFAFIVEIISKYIGFWMNFKGYLAFSILAIIGGLLLIFGAWLIPKWRRKLLDKTKQKKNNR